MDSKRQWSLLTGVLCLAILAGGYLFLVKPQHSHAKSYNAQTASVQQATQTLRSNLAHLVDESHSLATQESTLAETARQLPASPAQPNMLLVLDKTAQSTGVDLVNVAPGPVAAFTGTVPAPAVTASASATPSVTASTPTTTSSSPAAVAGLEQIPIVLTVSGSFFQMEHFVSGLEGLQRSMLVDSFAFAFNSAAANAATGSATAPPAPGSTGDVTATINVRVFVSTASLSGATIPSVSPATSAAGASS